MLLLRTASGCQPADRLPAGSPEKGGDAGAEPCPGTAGPAGPGTPVTSAGTRRCRRGSGAAGQGSTACLIPRARRAAVGVSGSARPGGARGGARPVLTAGHVHLVPPAHALPEAQQPLLLLVLHALGLLLQAAAVAVVRRVGALLRHPVQVLQRDDGRAGRLRAAHAAPARLHRAGPGSGLPVLPPPRRLMKGREGPARPLEEGGGQRVPAPPLPVRRRRGRQRAEPERRGAERWRGCLAGSPAALQPHPLQQRSTFVFRMVFHL